MIKLPFPRWQNLSMMAVLGLALSSTGYSREPWTTSRLKGTPAPPPDYRVNRVFSQYSFTHPTSIQEIPGTGEMLVTQMDGSVLTFPKVGDSQQLHHVIDLARLAGGTVSLFSAALHPDFQSNGLLFVCLVHPGQGRHTRVSRFATSRNPSGQLIVDETSERVIIQWPAGGHNAGCLRFGPDGLLYISTGDGAGPNPPDGLTTGQDVTDLLGAILRIDVDNTASADNYAVPVTNPFSGRTDARPEIFAYGLRNPWKFGIDSRTGDVFVADNGWETWEMIHHVTAGQNCGWPVMEGRAELRTEVPIGPTPIVPPARDHHHSEANSVIGGPVCRSAKLADLEGFFIYGDYITGTIWALKSGTDGYIARDVVDTDLRIVDFTQGQNGELFVLDYDYTGGIYELLPNHIEDLSEHFPRLLSQTGLFDSVPQLKPAAGVVPYDVVVPRWQDGAESQRWVAVPGSSSINLQADTSSIGFPDGTVLVKHLSVPTASRTPLETQILHYDSGLWNPYSYLWNEDGTDANLVPSVGSHRTVLWPERTQPEISAPRTWKAGATNECRLCHNAGSHFVLGFNPEQLQKKSDADRDPRTWHAELQEAGVLQAPSTLKTTLTLTDPHDTSQSLDERARSYLHANCSMCHHQGGNAIISFYLRKDLPFEQLKTDKGTGIGTFGMRNAKIIVPGDPYRSVLMYRMTKLGYSHMPYIGSDLVDSQGVALIAAWVRSLSKARSAETSPPLVPDSPEAKAVQILARRDSASGREAAVHTLVSSTEGSLALAERLHAGQLTEADLAAAIAAVAQSGSDIRGLFDHFIPEEQRRKTLGRTFDPELVLSRKGDALRGRLIFFSNDARCRNCHDISDAGKSVGPTLMDIAKKFTERGELLRHVMKPSEKIDDKYAAWLVITKQGRVLTGLKQSRDDSGIVLRTAEGKVMIVRSEDVEELQQSRTSLMPEAVLADMTAQEAADVVAFVQSLKAD